MSDDTDALLDATTGLVPPLLVAMDGLAFVGRHLHPPELGEVLEAVAGLRAPVEQGLEAFAAASWPRHLSGFAGHVQTAAGETLAAYDGLAACLDQANPALGAYRAMSFSTRAVEALYPVAFMLPPVGRYFVTPGWREDQATLARLAEENPARDNVGIMHASNGKTDRGGFSLYVPEYYDEHQPLPLVVALHGGSGHGRSFLWTWLRDARTRGAILATVTSTEDTWGLLEPARDSANLAAIVEFVRERYAVDGSRLLLTGMSDGGTFSYVSGLADGSPFTHLAPISASFHPLLLEAAPRERLDGLPVYLVHGALDWMFPVDVARLARDALTAAGARVEYRELEDLSHTYPREENDRILSWLLDEPLESPTGRD